MPSESVGASHAYTMGETTITYMCSSGERLSGSLERTCYHGVWLGEPPHCDGFCDLLPVYSAGFEVYNIDGDTVSSRLQQRAASDGDQLTLVCKDGHKPPQSLVTNYSCSGHLIVPSTDLKCEQVSPPHHRFMVTAGKESSLKASTVNFTASDRHVAHHPPFTSMIFGTTTFYTFQPKGYFDVGPSFSWFSFIRYEGVLNGESYPIISLMDGSNVM